MLSLTETSFFFFVFSVCSLYPVMCAFQVTDISTYL